MFPYRVEYTESEYIIQNNDLLYKIDKKCQNTFDFLENIRIFRENQKSLFFKSLDFKMISVLWRCLWPAFGGPKILVYIYIRTPLRTPLLTPLWTPLWTPLRTWRRCSAAIPATGVRKGVRKSVRKGVRTGIRRGVRRGVRQYNQNKIISNMFVNDAPIISIVIINNYKTRISGPPKELLNVYK